MDTLSGSIVAICEHWALRRESLAYQDYVCNVVSSRRLPVVLSQREVAELLMTCVDAETGTLRMRSAVCRNTENGRCTPPEMTQVFVVELDVLSGAFLLTHADTFK